MIPYTLNISKCYEILGLAPGASVEEIKQAYRGLVLKHHPDKCPTEESETRFRQISDAYQALRIQNIKAQKITQKFDDIYPE